MKWWRSLVMLFLGALLYAGMVPSARADLENRKTIVTFDKPVEVPGTVLPAGTYVFKLADLPGDNHTVQIFNRDETHIYATTQAISDSRPEPPDRTVFTFEQRAEHSPEAIKEWFYPDRATGLAFVYPKVPSVEIAKAASQQVASMPAEMAANITAPAESTKAASAGTMAEGAAKAVEPAAKEAETPAAAAAPSRSPAASGTLMAKNTGKQLPRTASSLPLLGLIGSVSLGAGASLRMLSTRLI